MCDISRKFQSWNNGRIMWPHIAVNRAVCFCKAHILPKLWLTNRTKFKLLKIYLLFYISLFLFTTHNWTKFPSWTFAKSNKHVSHVIILPMWPSKSHMKVFIPILSHAAIQECHAIIYTHCDPCSHPGVSCDYLQLLRPMWPSKSLM